MIQGGALRVWSKKKMILSDGIKISNDRKCLIIPPVFTVGKNKVKKDDTFTFITQDRLQLDENIAIVEWHPALYEATKGRFMGTPMVGPLDFSQPLRGHIAPLRGDLELNKLPWLARLWIQE